jgi:hypothetical protein
MGTVVKKDIVKKKKESRYAREERDRRCRGERSVKLIIKETYFWSFLWRHSNPLKALFR